MDLAKLPRLLGVKKFFYCPIILIEEPRLACPILIDDEDDYIIFIEEPILAWPIFIEDVEGYIRIDVPGAKFIILIDVDGG